MKTFVELRGYLKKTDTEKYNFNTPAEKRKSFLRVFLYYFLIVFVISIITGVIRLILNISFTPGVTKFPVLLIINILAFPVLEEIAFRLPLIHKRLYLSLSVLIISYYIISMLLSNDVVDISDRIIIRLESSISIAVMVYFILGIKIVGLKVKEFWDNHSKIVFYTFLLMFTFRNLDSYELTGVMLFFSPILLLPQFIGGIFLSFTRVKFGLIYAILLHVMINTSAAIPQIILYYASRF